MFIKRAYHTHFGIVLPCTCYWYIAVTIVFASVCTRTHERYRSHWQMYVVRYTNLMQRCTYTHVCEYKHLRLRILYSNSNVPITSTRQNYADIWHALFINSSTSCCYFNTSFMRSIFGRCHAHFIY